MAHRSFSYRTVMAGVAVALLLGALMASGLSAGQPAAADEHGDDGGGLTGAVDEVVDGVGDEEEEDEQEAADDGQPEEVVPDDGGGGDGGQESASEGGGGGEPAQDQSSEQQSGGSAPVPSGPQTAAGPGVQSGGGVPEGAASPDGGPTFGSSADSDMFATAPEVFTEDDDQRTARRPDELALASLPRDNGPANFAPAGSVPSQLIAAATGLLVMVGAGHALYATRRLAGAPLEVDEASDDGEDDHEHEGADEREGADEAASAH